MWRCHRGWSCQTSAGHFEWGGGLQAVVWAAAMALKSTTGGDPLMRTFNSKGVCWSIDSALNVSNVQRELCNVVKVTSLTRGMTIWLRVQSKCERFVIRQDMEGATLQEVTEMLDGEIHDKQFPVEGAVPCLRCFHLL